MVQISSTHESEKVHQIGEEPVTVEEAEFRGPAIDQKSQFEHLKRVHKNIKSPHHRMSRYWGNPNGSDYYLYALEGLSVQDSAEARRLQRDRFRHKLDIVSRSQTNSEHLSFLKSRLEIADQYDLSILDSGVLHHGNRLLTQWSLADDGTALSAVDIHGDEFHLRKNRKNSESTSNLLDLSDLSLNLSHRTYLQSEPVQFGYQNLETGAAIFLGSENGFERLASLYEVGQTLDMLLQLPENYLEHLEYLENEHVRIPKSRIEYCDFIEENIEDYFPKSLEGLSLKAFSFTLGNCRLKIRIPVDPEGDMTKSKRRSSYRPTSDDIKDIVNIIQKLVPVALLPPKLTLTFSDTVMRDRVYAFIAGRRHVIFSSVKPADRTVWMKNIILKTILHELTHVFHDENKLVTGLLYRCMMMDGWTMEYGDTNLTEYFAVLAENFYDHPERRVLFPNGYRLMYTLLKMRESGVRWSEDRQDRALIDIATNVPKSNSPKKGTPTEMQVREIHVKQKTVRDSLSLSKISKSALSRTPQVSKSHQLLSTWSRTMLMPRTNLFFGKL